MFSFPPARLVAVLLLISFGVSLQAQMPQEQAAQTLLTSARRAYGEKNYAFSRDRFREFLQKYGGHKEAPAARYGLALCLLDGPEKDCQAAVNELQAIAGAKEMPEHPFVLYYLGLARRGLGVKALESALAKPQEAAAHRKTANQRFGEAEQNFAAAIPALAAKVKPAAADAKELPVELEWAARSRCDQAEMQLRLSKPKEARDTAAPFFDDKSPLAKSRYRALGLYYYGFACFLLKEPLQAGKSLNRADLFGDPVFGTHARYLVARIHHQSGENAEAATLYEAAVAEYEKQKQAAREAIKQPDRFKNDPNELTRLTALANGPTPDHIARSTFHLAELLYEGGRFADALARFTAFVKATPQSPLVADAVLRQGFCQVQLKQYAEAIKTLQPLADKEARLADQCLFWIAKAQAGAADPANATAHEQALKTAINTFRTAADRAGQLANQDQLAKKRRAEILLEMADTQQTAKLYRDAASGYQQLLNDKALPERIEELQQRLATALHLAGDYAASDQVCIAFRKEHPKSPLLPAVLFRYAENAYFSAQAAEKNPKLPNRDAELKRLYDESIKRYQEIVEKHPEFAQVPLARYGQAMGHYRKGEIEKAKEILEAIPDGERSGELVIVPYQIADCMLRLIPAKIEDDAISAGKALEQLQTAAELLASFAAAQPNHPASADALLKLGHCQQRLAPLLAQPPERAKALAAARTAYEQLMQRFPKHEAFASAVFERAKVLALAGDVNGSVNELRRFTADPLKATPVAPLAVLRLATLLRVQNQAQQAADVLNQCRQQHESAMRNDPTRAAWVPLLLYHYGVALKEAGKRSEARAIFDQLIQQSPSGPESAEAALRLGQTLKEEGMQKVEQARKKLTTPNAKPDDIANANKLLETGYQDIREAVQFLEKQAARLQTQQPNSEARVRLHYEAAWGHRALAEAEVETARTKLQAELWQKLKEEAARKTPAGLERPIVPPPDVALKQVPLQPAEQKARAQYQAAFTALPDQPDLPLAWEARFELAELLAEREDFEPAIKLLKEALVKELSPELTDKVRLRLAVCLAAKGDFKEALATLQAITANPKSRLIAQARYRAGECHLQLGHPGEAVKHLAVFRDQQPLQNVAGLTDRALLRLGHAYAHLKQWDQSRQAHEQVVNRFGNSPWVHEARYGIGWAWQNQKRYDEAVNAYQQVTAALANELAAKAQLQIGLCRLEQKRHAEAANALLVVPFTYDYPELSAVALCEAARTFAEQKQTEQAARLLRRVLRDHPDSKWAQVAKERLETLKGS
jgi:tetratricopeptide (TPR) repeat protein